MSRIHSRHKLIQLIHVAKRELGMDVDDYRAMLSDVTGKQSCGEMSVPELEQVLTRLKSKGFKVKGGKRHSPKTRDKAKADKTVTDKIRAIWIDMHKCGFIDDGSEQALENWVKRTTKKLNHGVGIEKVDWLESNTFVARKVLEQLKQWRQRVE